MELLLVPRPLFQNNMTVEGYYMAAQFGNTILDSQRANPFDRAMDSPFIDFMNEVGLDALTQNKLVFIPVTQIQLVTDLHACVKTDNEKVVFLLDETVPIDSITEARCKYYTELGYSFAVVFDGSLENLKLIEPYVKYIFLKYTGKMAELSTVIKRTFPQCTVIGMDIADKVFFDNITMNETAKISLYDGSFYKVHVTEEVDLARLSPLKANYIQLLNIVNQEDFDFKKFARTIMQDTGLAIQFMRLVNNASKTRTEIRDFNQAAAMMGQKEIKKWVSTAVSNALCVDSPSEIMRLSLLRAKFCENLAKYFELAMVADNIFLMGLFSVLDIVLDMPIEDALKMVIVPPQVSNALINKSGQFYSVLYFAQQYEMGQWKEISRMALVRDISISQIHFAYKEAMLWYSNLINTKIDQSGIE